MASPKKFDISVGDVLSIDPGTAFCGAALWRDGKLIATKTLTSEGYSVTVSERLRAISAQLKAFLHLYEAHVTCVITENPPHTLLKATLGAILVTEGVFSMFNDSSCLSPAEWKSWAKKRGASGEFGLIKGAAALSSTGFPVPPGASDDVCDAIMVYLAFRDKYGTHKAARRSKR